MNYCWFFKFYIMTKKIIIVLLSLVFIILFIDYFINYFTLFQKYILSVLSLILGLIIYPINFKFKNIEDFMILPVLAISIFNIVNIFYLKNYSLKVTFFNILIGLFCFLQYFYYRKKRIAED